MFESWPPVDRRPVRAMHCILTDGERVHVLVKNGSPFARMHPTLPQSQIVTADGTVIVDDVASITYRR